MAARKTEKPAEHEAPELIGAGLGQIAFTAYSEAIDATATDEEVLPIWDSLIKERPYAAAAWCASAQAVIAATFERKTSS